MPALLGFLQKEYPGESSQRNSTEITSCNRSHKRFIGSGRKETVEARNRETETEREGHDGRDFLKGVQAASGG